jgi:hypothetical protein
MDTDFLSDLSDALQRSPEVRRLRGEDAEALEQRVAHRFGFPAAHAWWWEQLRPPVRSFEYGQGDGLSVLHSSLPSGSRDSYLFLTDDNPPPWICLQGPVDSLIRVLRELRFIECFFVDESLSWILFDTHHNAVIGTGDALRIPNSGA